MFSGKFFQKKIPLEKFIPKISKNNNLTSELIFLGLADPLFCQVPLASWRVACFDTEKPLRRCQALLEGLEGDYVRPKEILDCFMKTFESQSTGV